MARRLSRWRAGARTGRRLLLAGALALVTVTVAAVATVATEARAETIRLTLLHAAAPKSTAHTLFLRPWAQRLEAESRGRLDIAVNTRPATEAPEMLAALADGRADIAWFAPALSPGRFPRAEVFELPFMTASAEGASEAAFEIFRRRRANEFAGLHVILVHAEAPAWLHGARAPLRRIEDLRGKRLFAATRAMRRTLDAWGARAVALTTPGEVAAALDDGRLDGALMSFETAYRAGVIDATRYHTRPGRPPGLGTILHVLAMNATRYEALPDDLRRLIDASGGRDLANRVGRTWDSVEKLDLKRSRGPGHIFYKLGDAEIGRWRRAAQPVIGRWIAERDAAGDDGAGLLAAARAAISKYEVVRESQ